MPEESVMLRVPQACQISAIGRSKFYELLASGDIESVRVGRTRLVPRDALMAYLERLRKEQNP